MVVVEIAYGSQYRTTMKPMHRAPTDNTGKYIEATAVIPDRVMGPWAERILVTDTMHGATGSTLTGDKLSQKRNTAMLPGKKQCLCVNTKRRHAA